MQLDEEREGGALKCPVCRVHYLKLGPIQCLPCGHFVCAQCLVNMLPELVHVCPKCRVAYNPRVPHMRIYF